MTLMRSTALSLALGLAFVLPAPATEDAEQELRAPGECGAGLVVYQQALNGGPVVVTQADRDLADRFGRLESRVARRANSLADAMSEERSDAVLQEVVAGLKSRVETPGLTLRQILDDYGPTLEACIVRANALPAA